jgi:hypothetical protein
MAKRKFPEVPNEQNDPNSIVWPRATDGGKARAQSDLAAAKAFSAGQNNGIARSSILRTDGIRAANPLAEDAANPDL